MNPATEKLRNEIADILCGLLRVPHTPRNAPEIDLLVDKLMQCAMIETLSSIQKHGTVYSALKQI